MHGLGWARLPSLCVLHQGRESSASSQSSSRVSPHLPADWPGPADLPGGGVQPGILHVRQRPARQSSSEAASSRARWWWLQLPGPAPVGRRDCAVASTLSMSVSGWSHVCTMQASGAREREGEGASDCCERAWCLHWTATVMAAVDAYTLRMPEWGTPPCAPPPPPAPSSCPGCAAAGSRPA